MARVDGAPVFFESDGPSLVASPEGFASAFLLPAAARRRRLEVDAPLDAAWLAGARSWGTAVRSFWGTKARLPRGRGTQRTRRARGPETALCFSGGVDSFYSLLRSDVATSSIVYVHGFDRPLADEALLPRIGRMLDDVAAARGIRKIVVRTDLREQPVFARVNWERSHGGALVCVGHLLGPAVGRLLISATFVGADAPPWGSHERLDPLLGGSTLEVLHVGGELRRAEKLERIAGEELVQRHLRVCWESTGPAYNCSRCDKCLATMLVLKEGGHLRDFAVFEPPDDFAAAFDALPRTIYRKTIRAIAASTGDARLHAALARLDKRSGAHPAYDR